MSRDLDWESLFQSACGLSMKEVLRRCLEQVRRDGAPPPPRPLSAEKRGSPKVMALDANKWIELSRTNLGLPRSAPYRPALEAVRQAVEAGDLVVPVLGVNASEAAEHSDPSRRERLARFMVELSTNLAFLDPLSSANYEVESAVRRRTPAGPLPPLRPILLHRGVGVAVTGKSVTVEGGPKDMKAAINMAMQGPELSATLLAHAIDRDTVEGARSTDRDGLRKLVGIRALDQTMPLEERRLLEVRTVLTDGRVADKVRSLFAELGSTEAYAALIASDSEVRSFELDVPSMHVSGTLMRWRDRDQNNASHVNDFKDLQFLEQAIPYADIVVAENQWAAIARATKLDRHYDTVVMSDLRELPKVLSRIGSL